MDLPGFDHEIDVVVGDEASEPLGDPTEFELHTDDPIDEGASLAPTTVPHARRAAGSRRPPSGVLETYSAR
ncbi:hypothetical protein GCM10022200_13110 [Microbacterium awajiense]|uniref:Uncharacterized protein n=1 Tax=Microbacterium awajiense TaxID=415214 RepID=A0ABP7AGL9_9MICO